MTSFKCPNCGSAMAGDTGQVVRCAGCGQSVAVPKGGMSTGVIVALVIGGVLILSCPCFIVAGLAAITTIGSNANSEFKTVGSSLTGGGR